MISKRFLIILLTVLIAISVGVLLISTKQASPTQLLNNKLVVCDSEKENNISRLMREGGVVKDIESMNPIIVGFYTTRENRDLKEIYKDLAEAEKFGWGEFYDFIEGSSSPTPLSGLKQPFNDGDLIKIEPDWTKDGIALRIRSAEKLSLPTRQDFLSQAEKTFNTNSETIFQCANSRSSDFPSFRSGIASSSVVWDRLSNQALVSHQGIQEYKNGHIKVIDVSILLDQSSTPLAIFVGSKVVPLSF